MREFEVLKKLNHKNIVKLFAVEEEVNNFMFYSYWEYLVLASERSLIWSQEEMGIFQK